MSAPDRSKVVRLRRKKHPRGAFRTTQDRRRAVLGLVAAREIKSIAALAEVLNEEYDADVSINTVGNDLRALGITKVDGTYVATPYEVTRADVWDAYADDVVAFVVDAHLKGDQMYLDVRGGVGEALEVSLDGLRLDTTRTDGILAAVSGYSSVVVFFQNEAKARTFWVKTKQIENPLFREDGAVAGTILARVRSPILVRLRDQGHVTEAEVREAYDLSSDQVLMVMRDLMRAYPIREEPAPHRTWWLHGTSLFGIGAPLSDSERAVMERINHAEIDRWEASPFDEGGDEDDGEGEGAEGADLFEDDDAD